MNNVDCFLLKFEEANFEEIWGILNNFDCFDKIWGNDFNFQKSLRTLTKTWKKWMNFEQFWLFLVAIWRNLTKKGLKWVNFEENWGILNNFEEI